MPIPAHNPIYNARIREMLNPRCCLRKMYLLFFPYLFAAGAFASPWQSPAEQLARKIAAITSPGGVVLNLDNRSTLSRADSDEIRRQLLTELGALGVRFVGADQAAASVQVTLSENRQSYVWIAEIHQGTNEPSIFMISVPRPNGAATHSQSAMTIKKTLLWSDSSRILDVAFLTGNPLRMILLEPESIVLYSQQNGQWQWEQLLPIVTQHSWPRDLRGRLMLRKDHLFDAYLPGIFCRSSSNLPLAITCQPSDDPWPLAADPFNLSGFFAASRNFFTGVLSPGVQKQTTVAPFYSAAPLPRDKYTPWIFSTLDGQLHLLDGITDQTVAGLGWGSDLAAVKSACGSGWQILATSNHDNADDAVTAFEFPDREPVVASQPAEFSGRITALWTETDENGAITVVQNSGSGSYEAYRLTISCGQ
jgi:hypothetical protein